MKEPRFSSTGWRYPLLALSALLVSACSGPTAPTDEQPGEGESATVSTQASTDQCAPTPASQATSGDTRYYRYSSAKTWTAAKADCVAMGGRLAVPTDSTTNGIVRGLQSGGANMYIGLYQASGQSSPGAGWLTVEDATPTFTKWRNGEPNDAPTAGENGQENCAQMYANDGTWNDSPCGSSPGQYVCEFGSAPVACGSGATCGIPSGGTTYKCQCPSGQKYNVENQACYGGALTVQINKLELDHVGHDVFVNFPIHGKIGVKGTGSTNNVHLSLGLMEKPASGANATAAELGALRSCVVANGNITLTGDGSQQYLEVDGVVPPECLDGDPQRLANLFVLVDAVDEVTTETNKYLVFNEKEAQTPLGQACSTPDPVTGQPVAGCVINVTIKPSPGLDIALVGATPLSSVGVLAPATQNADVTPGQAEAARPLVVVNAEVAAYGRNHHDASAATMPGQIDFTYQIAADPDTASVGWKSLNVNPDGQHAAISSIKPNETLQIDARLYPTAEFRALTAPGGAWAGATSFKVRGCATVPFGENGDPLAGGANGASNNCRVFSISVVAGDSSSHAASTYSANGTYSSDWGSSSTLKLSLSAASNNSFDVSTGASSENYAKATLSGFFGSFDLVHGWANGYAKITNTSVDAGLKVFGVALASYTAALDVNPSWSKEKCYTYSYGIVVTSIDISGCFSITAGLDTTLSLTNTSVSAQVRPYASATLSVTASLNLTLYKASLSASLTLLGLNTSSSDGVVATLSFTRPTSSTMTIAFDTLANLRITTLSGSISVTVEELEADWCKKKVWGVKVSYPCWSWDTLASYTIFSYSGYTLTSKILDRELASYSLSL